MAISHDSAPFPRARLRVCAAVVLAWFGLAFAVESVGLLAHTLNTAAAVACLLLSAVVQPVPGTTERRSKAVGILMAVAGMLLLPVHPSIRLFAAGLWFCGLDWMRGDPDRDRPWPGLAFGCLVGGVFSYLYSHSLLTWYASQLVSESLSAVGRSLLSGFTLGPTFSGIALLVLAAGCLIGRWGTRAGKGLAGLVAASLTAGLLTVAYVVLFAATQPDPEAPLRGSLAVWQQIQHAVNPVFMPAVLTSLLAAPIGLYLTLGKSSAQGERQPALSRGRLLLPIPLAVIAVLLLMMVPGGPRKGSGPGGQLRFALLEPGFHNWLTPNHERYGSRSGGMFGNLPILLRCMGWDGDFVSDIDAATLADRDLLFMANPQDGLSPDAVAAVERFVEDGGSLLLLGDHTWRKDGEPRMILDDPIRRTHVRFRFDSAYYFIGGWLHSMQYWPSPVTAGLRDETNETGCVVGASLDVQYPAVPLVIGRWGYADRGHDTKDPRRGYMDNGMADPGERLGDLALVALENVGRGRVAVVGETSGFVNAIQTQTWGFTSRVLRWLGSDGRAGVPAWRDALSVLLLLGVAGWVATQAPRQRLAVPIACVALLGSGLAARAVMRASTTPQPLKGDIAYVDLSHVGLHSLEAWRDDAVSGVYLNFMREGYFAVGGLRFDRDQIQASKVFVTVAPTQPYSSSELDFLDTYMRDGGAVILSVGYEEKAGSENLLSRYGLSIPHKPHGRIAVPVPGTSITPNFWAAWPVLSSEPADTLVPLRGDPVIIRRRVGRGQLIVIGDSKFLHCRNFETEEGAIMPNIQFFRWLVQNVLKEPGP